FNELLTRFLTEFCFGDFYTRGGLILSQRELLVLCALAAIGDTSAQLAPPRPASHEPVLGGRPRTLLDGRPDLLICEWMPGPRTGSPVIPHRRTQDPRRGVLRGRFSRVHLPRTPVSRPETRLQPLEASRA